MTNGSAEVSAPFAITPPAVPATPKQDVLISFGAPMTNGYCLARFAYRARVVKRYKRHPAWCRVVMQSGAPASAVC